MLKSKNFEGWIINHQLDCFSIDYCWRRCPESAVSFEGVAFTVERAEGEPVIVAAVSIQLPKNRSYNVTICDHCARIVEENFAEGVAEGFEVKAK